MKFAAYRRTRASGILGWEKSMRNFVRTILIAYVVLITTGCQISQKEQAEILSQCQKEIGPPEKVWTVLSKEVYGLHASKMAIYIIEDDYKHRLVSEHSPYRFQADDPFLFPGDKVKVWIHVNNKIGDNKDCNYGINKVN